MNARPSNQSKTKIRLLGTQEGIFNYIISLDPDAKIAIEDKAWKKINVIIDNIHYDIDPLLYKKFPCPQYTKGLDSSKKYYFTTAVDYYSAPFTGVVCCGLSDEDKEIYDICGKKNLIFVDYDSKTTTPENCLIKIGTGGVDNDLIKNFYEKTKFLFFVWNNKDYSSLNILHNDVRNCILLKFTQDAFKNNLTSWSFFQKNLQPLQPNKEIISKESGFSNTA